MWPSSSEPQQLTSRARIEVRGIRTKHKCFVQKRYRLGRTKSRVNERHISSPEQPVCRNRCHQQNLPPSSVGLLGLKSPVVRRPDQNEHGTKKRFTAIMNARPDSHAIERRKFRKGTHSCAECRRRKVKCVFATPDSTTCIVCLRRNTHCFSQADAALPAIVDGIGAGAEDDPVLLLDRQATPKALSCAMSYDATAPLYAASGVDSVFMPPTFPATAGSRHGLLAHHPSMTSISRDGAPTMSATRTDQSQQTASGVAIAGIPKPPSCHHTSGESAEADQESLARNITTPVTAPTPARFHTNRTEGAASRKTSCQAAAMLNPPMMPTDASPPFPAASFDDLVMDMLLRQSEVPLPDEVNSSEGWSVSILP